VTDITTNKTLQQLDAEIQALNAQRLLLLQNTEQTQQSDIAYPCIKTGNRKVVVIGGQGQLGQLFVNLFKRSDYQVSIVEKNDWSDATQILSEAALVLVAVPINITLDIIAKLSNLSDDCVLADVTSIKQKPVKAMLAVHSGPVVGLHPMFGPDVINFDKQTVIVCEGRSTSDYQWLIQQLQSWHAVTYQISAAQHDSAMAMVQVMRHFSTVAYGYHLMHEDTNLAEIIHLSSPIYRLELAMVGRLFAQDPALYTDIIFSNLDNSKSLRRFIKRFEQLLVIMESGDKEAFAKVFNQISDWFGDYAEQFLLESSEMLIHTNKAVTK